MNFDAVKLIRSLAVGVTAASVEDRSYDEPLEVQPVDIDDIENRVRYCVDPSVGMLPGYRVPDCTLYEHDEHQVPYYCTDEG